MNLLDIVVLAIIAISALLSLRVGLIREIFALASLLIGLLGAIVLGRAYGDRIPDLLGSEVATQVVFFAVCFLIVYALISFCGTLITRALKAMRLSSVDHLLGLAFGAVRGALIAFLVIVLLVFILPDDHALLLESRAYALAQEPLRAFSELLPEQAREALQKRPSLDDLLRRRDDSGDRERPRPRGIPL